jgi:hypothetical protein
MHGRPVEVRCAGRGKRRSRRRPVYRSERIGGVAKQWHRPIILQVDPVCALQWRRHQGVVDHALAGLLARLLGNNGFGSGRAILWWQFLGGGCS